MKDTNYTIQTSKDNYVTYTTIGNKTMNNYEKIKNMSIEKMVNFIRELTNDEYTCSYCIDDDCEGNFLDRDYNRCNKGIKLWLQSESD